MRHLIIISALLAVLQNTLLSYSQVTQSINPCLIAEGKKGDGFPIGIAYWPGGKIEDWGSSETGVQPCTAGAAVMKVATYNIEVDKIALLRTSNETERGMFTDSASANPGILSVVAFSGELRSEARYIWSSDSAVTGGIGVLSSLTLILQFDEGSLKYMRWQEAGCVLCPASNKCLKTGQVYDNATAYACADYDINTCSSSTPSQGSDPGFCLTSIQVGTSGTDADHAVLNTGTQLQTLQQHSISGLYSSASNAIGNAASGVTNVFSGGDPSSSTGSTPQPSSPTVEQPDTP